MWAGKLIDLKEGRLELIWFKEKDNQEILKWIRSLHKQKTIFLVVDTYTIHTCRIPDDGKVYC